MTGKWRTILLLSLVTKFYFSTQPSYIHPDEFFQSFQILYNDNLPWEVIDKSNINRSIFPLLITHYPSIYIGESFGFTTYQIYLLSRIQMTLISWFITDWCIYRIIPTKHERVKCLLFTMSSYLTLIHQSHTFSNSTETCILLPTLYIINDIRSYLETRSSARQYSFSKLITLGFLIAFGTFNRITFCGWILVPSFYLLKYFLRFPISSIIPVMSFLITSYLIIQIDTLYYNAPSLTIAPLNNLIYNMNSENLSKHGLHSRFTHILVNYPQLMGPLIFLIFPFNIRYIKTTTFLSIVSGFIILSIFPHQELRFLLPSIPLLSTSIDFQIPESKILKKCYKLIFLTWILFNVILSVLYGLFHQAGVVPTMNELNTMLQSINADDDSSVSLIFWRTYPPPTWMLSDTSINFTYLSKLDSGLVDYDAISCSNDYVFTLMGAEKSVVDDIVDIVSKCNNYKNNKILLICPKNAILNVDYNSYATKWEYFWNLDLDHFEYDLFGMDTFKPGIGIYQIN